MNHAPIETFTHAGKKVKIYVDSDPMNPREWDNLATLACWHRRYRLGDVQVEHCTEDELRERLAEEGEEILALLPLYLYDHSGITMSTGPFSCGWDSGQVGWAYVTRERAKIMGTIPGSTYTNQTTGETETYDEAWFEEAIRSEVETYDQYLRNDVYFFEIEGVEGDYIDGCGGYFGIEDAREQAKEAARHAEDPAVERAVEELSGRATYAMV